VRDPNHCSRHSSIWSISRCCDAMMSPAISFRSGCVSLRAFAASAMSIASRWCGTMASMKAWVERHLPGGDRLDTRRLGVVVTATAADRYQHSL
jgi:hypothetical protein